MEIKEILSRKKQIKTKLMAATSMLLVSSIMLSTTTYAWFTLSTAPEVTEMQTTAGSNGALEIALQSNEANAFNQNEITSRVGSSSSLESQSAVDANKTWGNIVELADNYGLEGVTLYPARLNLDMNKTTEQTAFVNTGSYLSLPEFGTDGRISDLTETTQAYYRNGTLIQSNDNYGVNILGNFSGETSTGGTKTLTKIYERQDILNQSATMVEQFRTKIKGELQSVISNNSAELVDLILYVCHMVEFDDVNYKQINEMKSIVAQLSTVTSDAENSMRYALMAYAAADSVNYPEEELAELYSNYTKLTLSDVKNIADNKNYSELSDAVAVIIEAEQSITNAKELLNEKDTSSAIMAIGQIISPGAMSVNDNIVSISAPEAAFVYLFDGVGYDGQDGSSDVMCMWSSSGLFSDMTTIVGDYQAVMQDNIDLGGMEMPIYAEVFVTGGLTGDDYNPELRTGCLGKAYTNAIGKNVSGEISVSSTIITKASAYGYEVDFALRTSSEGDLLLQQEGVDRVTATGSAEDRLPSNNNTQGAGSTMTFTFAPDMVSSQIEDLMKDIYLVFMNTSTGQVYGIAVSDSLSLTQRDDGEWEAKSFLQMYDAKVSNGKLELGSYRDDSCIINDMQPNEPYYITAIVYLNGDQVKSEEFSSVGNSSLAGMINLQFTNSAGLQAMNYGTDYYTK